MKPTSSISNSQDDQKGKHVAIRTIPQRNVLFNEFNYQHLAEFRNECAQVGAQVQKSHQRKGYTKVRQQVSQQNIIDDG